MVSLEAGYHQSVEFILLVSMTLTLLGFFACPRTLRISLLISTEQLAGILTGIALNVGLLGKS